MATWTQPTANALSASTYIKDTDDKLQSTMDDLEAFVNSTAPYVGVGLTDDFVDRTNAQSIAGIKTFSDTPVFSSGITGDVTGDVTGNADTATLLSAGTDRDLLDNALPLSGGAMTGALQLNDSVGLYLGTGYNFGAFSVGGNTFMDIRTAGKNLYIRDSLNANLLTLNSTAGDITTVGQVKGITPISAEDLTRKDYVDGLIPTGGLSSGTYTPTITYNLNCTSSHVGTAKYTRVGSVVAVSGRITIDPTSTGLVKVYLTLPISTSFADTNEAVGTLTSEDTYDSGVIKSYSTDNEIILWFDAQFITSQNFAYTYQYEM